MGKRDKSEKPSDDFAKLADAALAERVERERAVREAPGWSPETEGQTVIGLVEGFEIVELDGVERRVVTVKQEDGNLVSVWESATLTRDFDRESAAGTLKIGALVAVRYYGEVTSKRGRTIKEKRLVVLGK